MHSPRFRLGSPTMRVGFAFLGIALAALVASQSRGTPACLPYVSDAWEATLLSVRVDGQQELDLADYGSPTMGFGTDSLYGAEGSAIVYWAVTTEQGQRVVLHKEFYCEPPE